MRVLLIAPPAPANLPELDWPRELQSLGSIRGVDLSFITGEAATLDHIAEALCQPNDLVDWCGHGAGNRLAVGPLWITGDWLATQARAGAPECIIVGACYSGQRDEQLDSIGEAISAAGMHSIVYEVEAVDRAAAVYAREFVRSMAAVFDVVRANRVASAMCAQINQHTAAGVRLHAGIVNGYREFARRFASMETSVAGLNCKVDDVLVRLDRLEQNTGRRR